ncbi:MAG: ExeM/NucH family extracellular endonuclease [Acidimicrobiia bacterium]
MRRSFSVFLVLAMVVVLAPAAFAVDLELGECGDPFTPIYDIQGDGASSPEDGNDVVTEGIVTVAHQADANEIRGFFIQDPVGDGDPATSDGVFVSHGDAWGPNFEVAPGDHVRILGSVDEEWVSGGTRTQIEWLDDATTCGVGTVKALKIDARNYRTDEERLEGMYVQFQQKLAVTDTYNLANNGEVWLGEMDVVPQPTEIFGADDPRAEELADDNMARSIYIDDGIRFGNPHDGTFLNSDGTLRLGDEFRKLTGAVWFDYYEYRIVPNRGDVDIRIRNNRPAKAPSVGGKLVVGSANVLNYWTTLGGRGASTPEQLAVQEEKLVAELLGMDADILALQEIENDPANVPITKLVTLLNAADDSHTWTWVGEPAGGYNEYPIRNEIVYRDTVEPYDERGLMTLRDPLFDEGGTRSKGRPPIAQAFEANGEVFTVMVNHLKSKSCSNATGEDQDQGDGQSCYNLRRTLQATAILDYVDDVVDEVGDPDVLVVGDMNAYMEEDPIHEFESELVNLVEKYDPKHYSYNFYAGFAAPWIGRGTLDHAFANDSMSKQVTKVATWHINADEPRFLDWYDPTVTAPGPFRASDHDPVIIGLSLHSKKS